jgi:FixJ family two-component response regulator
MIEGASERAVQIVAIVDDDEAIRPALARLIRTLGYQPRTFASADALLLEFDDLRPACVLSDIQMPGMNGHVLIEELRRRSPDLPIILMTAYPSLAYRQPAVVGGTLEYMAKPLDDDRLQAWLSRVIGEPPDLQGSPR